MELTESERPLEEKSLTELFNEAFPFYLSIGMSYSEFWQSGVPLCRYYREAYKEKQNEINFTSWLNGLYVYDALVSALSGLGDKKPKTYAKEPYNIFDTTTEEEKIRLEQAKGEAFMHNFVNMFQNTKEKVGD